MRSDVYAFGATLYHLLTNHPPVEARERFLSPGSLILPKQINPNLSTRTERAILWAMSLHPDDRPQDIETFRQSLTGELNPVSQPRRPGSASSRTNRTAFASTEWILVGITVGVLILSFISTLMR